MIYQILKICKTKIRVLLFKFIGNSEGLNIQAKRNHQWFGNDYGGFYVCPDNLNDQSIIYSFGIGEDISFDRALASRYNGKIFMFDPTPKSIAWIKMQNLENTFCFCEYGIGSTTSMVDFYLPKNTDYVSGSLMQHKDVSDRRTISVPIRAITDITSDLGHKHIDVIKMDIEGAEYDVIPSILKSDVSFDQILIEFHSRFIKNGKTRTKSIINLLNSHGYEIFAVSNSLEEVSFIRKEAVNRGCVSPIKACM